MTCSACGAHNATDASWCGLCHQPLAAVPAPAVPGRVGPVASAPPSFTYTRWGKTVTTFGPVGRLAWTAGVLLVAAGAVFSQDIFAIGVLCFVVAPLVLRSVWARGRVL